MINRKELVSELKKVNRFLTSKFMQVKMYNGYIWFHDDVMQYQSKQIIGIPEDWSFEFNSFDLLKILNAYTGKEVEFTREDLEPKTIVKKLQIMCDFQTALTITPKDLEYLDDLNEIIFKEESVNPNFVQILEWVLKAMSTDETRYHMCGVGFGNMVLAATDGRRAHWTEWADVFRDNENFSLGSLFFVSDTIVNAIVNSKLNIIKSGYWVNEEGNTTLMLGTQDGSILILHQQDKKMSNITRVIPENNSLTSNMIDPKFYDLLMMVKQALKLQDDKSHAVHLKFLKDTISVSYTRKWVEPTKADPRSISEELTEVGIVRSNNSEELFRQEIRLNVQYLLDAIKGTAKKYPVKPKDFIMNIEESLDMELSFSVNEGRASRAVLVETPGCKALVMPMQM